MALDFKQYSQIQKIVIPDNVIYTGDFINKFNAMVNLTNCIIPMNNVTNMSGAYNSCINLTGSPVCGPNVTDMSYAYANCTSLTGSPICGDKVTDMSYAYANCFNLTNNAYFYSNNISSACGCFYGKDNSKQLNVYVHANTTSLNTLLTTNVSSLVGAEITWNEDTTNAVYYNAAYNIYIHPVSDVRYVYELDNIDKKLVDFTYEENEDGTYTLTGWKGTYNGKAIPYCVIPDCYGIVKI